jgi:hypothetical protein
VVRNGLHGCPDGGCTTRSIAGDTAAALSHLHIYFHSWVRGRINTDQQLSSFLQFINSSAEQLAKRLPAQMAVRISIEGLL